MMKSIVHKLREQEIYCITFNRVFYEKLKPCGKPHKDMRGMPKNWAALTKEQCCEMVVPTNHYAMAILTGAISNLTVIDFDIHRKILVPVLSTPLLTTQGVIFWVLITTPHGVLITTLRG